MKTLVKVIINAETINEFGELYGKRTVVSAEAWNAAAKVVQEQRWGNTQYMTTVAEETAARCLGVSACNWTLSWKKVYTLKVS